MICLKKSRNVSRRRLAKSLWRLINKEAQGLMSNPHNEGNQDTLGRRKFLKAGLMLGAASLLSRLPVVAQSTETVQPTGDDADKRRLIKADRRRLGSLEASSIGLGCLPLVGYYDVKLHKNASIALIRTAFEHGATFFDTAEVYGPYFSEECVGEAVASFRRCGGASATLPPRAGCGRDGCSERSACLPPPRIRTS